MAAAIDDQTIFNVLAATMINDENARQGAERTLAAWEENAGFLTTMLRFVSNQQIDKQIRLSAVLVLKNAICRRWETKVAEEERQMIRQNILESLITAPSLVQTHLGLCINAIASFDYPERWPGLVDQILQNFATQDQTRIAGALVGLRFLYKKYEYKRRELRAPFDELLARTLPVLYGLVSHIVALNSWQPHLGLMAKNVFKCYYAAMHIVLPNMLQDPACMAQWIPLMLTQLQTPIPEAVQPIPEQRAEFAWWGVKKWILYILDRLFRRYGLPDVAGKEYKTFCKHWLAQAAIPAMNSVMAVLNWKRTGQFVTDTCLKDALNFMVSCLPNNAVFKALKPHLRPLVAEVIFPIICLTADDIALWTEDPYEFVRKQFDVIQEYYFPKMAATSLLLEMAKVRPAATLPLCSELFAGILNRYLETPPANRNHLEKEAALLGLGIISEELKEREPYASNIEALITTHVLPELTSDNPYLRARACWVYGQFSELDFKDRPNFTAAIQKILACLRDGHPPVRIQSALAMRHLIRDETCAELVKPLLQPLVEEFFKLMDEMGNEELLLSLEAIIDQFGEEMQPLALDMATRLCQHFVRLANCDEDDDDSALAAVGCLRALVTLMTSMQRMSAVFEQIEPAMLSVFVPFINVEKLEFLTEVLQLVEVYTFWVPRITPALWGVYRQMCTALGEWAYDYFEEMLPGFDNFITRDPQTFASVPEHTRLMYELINKAMTDTSENMACYAAELSKSFFMACKGTVDAYLPPLIKTAWARFQSAESSKLKVFLLEVLACGLYNNPALFMQTCAQDGTVQPIFFAWFEALPRFTRLPDKKIAIMALASVFSLPPAQLPATFQSAPAMKVIVESLVKLNQEYTTLKAEKEKEEKELQEKAERGELLQAVEEEVPETDGHDEPTEEDFKGDDDDDDDDGDDDDDDAISDLADDEGLVILPIDGIDHLTFTTDAFQTLNSAAPELFTAIRASLDAATLTTLDQLIAEGLRRREAAPRP